MGAGSGLLRGSPLVDNISSKGLGPGGGRRRPKRNILERRQEETVPTDIAAKPLKYLSLHRKQMLGDAIRGSIINLLMIVGISTFIYLLSHNLFIFLIALSVGGILFIRGDSIHHKTDR